MGQGKQAELLPEVESPLTPLGPSDIFMLGILSLGILFEYHELKPVSKEIFSSKVRFSNNLFISDIRFYLN
jgi:hypothetical protein